MTKEIHAGRENSTYEGVSPFTSALLNRFTSDSGQMYLHDLLLGAPMIFGAQVGKKYGLKPEGWAMDSSDLVANLKKYEGGKLPQHVEIALLDAAGDLTSNDEKQGIRSYPDWHDERISTMKKLALDWSTKHGSQVAGFQFMPVEALINLPNSRPTKSKSIPNSRNIVELTDDVLNGMFQSIDATMATIREIPDILMGALRYAKEHPFQVLFQIILVKAISACGGAVPTPVIEKTPIVQQVEASNPQATEASADVVIPNPPVVETNSTQVAPTEAPATPETIVLPSSINNFDLSKIGTDQKLNVDNIKEIAGSAATNIIDWQINWFWANGYLKDVDGKDAGSSEEAAKRFADKYDLVGDQSQSAWSLMPKEKTSGKLFHAVGPTGIPFISGMPIGVTGFEDFDLVASDMPEGGVSQSVVHTIDGKVFTVIVLDKDGKAIAWVDSRDGSMKLESPVSVPAGFENAPQEAKDLIGKEGIAIDDTTIYEVATGKVLFQKFGNEFVDTRLGLPLNEKDGLAHELYFRNGAAAYEYMFTEGNIIQNDRSVVQQFRYNEDDLKSKMDIFASSNLVYLGNDYFGHMTVYVGESNNFGIVTHSMFSYNGTDQIVTFLQYRSKNDDRIHYVFVKGDVNYLEDSSEYQLRK